MRLANFWVFKFENLIDKEKCETFTNWSSKVGYERRYKQINFDKNI